MLAEEVETLYQQLKRISSGEELQLVEATFYAINQVASVKELKENGALLFALTAATIGISEGEALLIPESWKKGCFSIALAMRPLLPYWNMGKMRLLALLLTVTITLETLLMSSLKGKHSLLSIDILLQTLLKGGILIKIGEVWARTAGASQTTSGQVAHIIVLLLLANLFVIVATQSRDLAEELAESLSPYLLEIIKKAEQPLTECLSASSVHLLTSKMAFEENNYRVACEGVLRLLDELNMSEEELKKYLKEKGQLADRLYRFLVSAAELAPVTGMIQG